MVCLSVLADNPRDLVSGLSFVHMETHGIPILNLFYLFIQYFKRVALLAKLANLPSVPL